MMKSFEKQHAAYNGCMLFLCYREFCFLLFGVAKCVFPQETSAERMRGTTLCSFTRKFYFLNN